MRMITFAHRNVKCRGNPLAKTAVTVTLSKIDLCTATCCNEPVVPETIGYIRAFLALHFNYSFILGIYTNAKKRNHQN